MNVFFVDSLPSYKNGTCVFYNENHKNTENWEVVKISDICRENIYNWNQSLWKWHISLVNFAAENDKYSYIMPGSRLHLGQQYIKELYFCLGLKIYLEKKAETEIYIVGAPNKVKFILNEFISEDIKLIYKSNNVLIDSIRLNFKIIFQILKSIGSVLLYWTPFGSIDASGKNIKAIVFSLYLNNTKNAGTYNDHFYGKMFEEINSEIFWLYKPAGRFNKKVARKSLFHLQSDYQFDFSLLKFADLFWCFKNAVVLKLHMKKMSNFLPVLDICGVRSQLFSKYYFTENFLVPFCFSELSLFRSTQHLISQTKPNCIIFPYEEKGMEKAIIMAAKNDKVKIKTIGFAHPAYNSTLLYLGHFDHNSTIPRPDIIWASGTGFESWLNNFWNRVSTVVSIGTYRHFPNAHDKSIINDGNDLRVLILTGNPSELYVFKDWLINFPDFLCDCQITLRPHPQGWHKQNNIVSKELKTLGINRIDNHSKLVEQLDSTDVVLFCSSSSVVEAIQHGKIAVRVGWDELWDTNPIHSITNAIPFCSNPIQLQETLAKIRAMPLSELQDLKNQQRLIADSIYSKFDSIALENLISNA